MKTSGRSPAARAALACPVCKSEIELTDRFAQCRACPFLRSQNDSRFVDLRPLAENRPENSDDRQHAMETWYRELARDRGSAVGCFESDYSGASSVLERVHGSVVDIGGGLGMARHYIPSFDQYLIVEPSVSWLDEAWDVLADQFRCLAHPVDFVRGVGEMLPLRSHFFDAGLALWILNHAREPFKVVEEAHRVLRPGGLLIVILEDITPTDGDIRTRPELIAIRDNEVQADHIRIDERDFLAHARGLFGVLDRRWVRHYLSFVLRAKPTLYRDSRCLDSAR